MVIPENIPFPFNYMAAFFTFCWNELGSVSFFGFITIKELVIAIIIYELVVDLLKKMFGRDKDGDS